MPQQHIGTTAPTSPELAGQTTQGATESPRLSVPHVNNDYAGQNVPRPYYDHGGITIYHGDCGNILPHLVFDAIVTDPPYGMSYRHGARRGGAKLGHDGVSIVGDDEPFDPSHLLAPSLPTNLWGANHYADKLPPSRGWLTWDKRDGSPPNDQSDCELAWTNLMKAARLFSRYWSGGVRKGREQAEGRLHVNQKPVELMHWCLGFLPKSVRVIIDPYCGSGSTLVAARELGFRAIGIEIDKNHCRIAANRLSQQCLPLGDLS